MTRNSEIGVLQSNMLTVTRPANDTLGNRLTQAVAQSPERPALSQFAYDPLGRRLSKTVNGTATSFLYDGEQILTDTNAQGTPTTQYVWGPGLDELRDIVKCCG